MPFLILLIAAIVALVVPEQFDGQHTVGLVATVVLAVVVAFWFSVILGIASVGASIHRRSKRRDNRFPHDW